MLRHLIIALLVATVASQNFNSNPFFNQFRQQLFNIQQQRQQQQQSRFVPQQQFGQQQQIGQQQQPGQQIVADGTETRIGLVRDQLGNPDPVPGSDYPSRVVNNNPQSQSVNNGNNQGTFQPTYPLASPSGQTTSDNLQQPTTAVNTVGRTPKNEECYCANQGECKHSESFDGAGLIDIRIVNKRPTIVNNQLQCSSQYQDLCCPSVSAGPAGCPAATQRSCGRRNFIPVPGYSKQPAEAQFGAYPWVATILRGADEYVCSGVLIDNQWVLTVAHHLDKYRNNYSGLKIRFGEWDASDPKHEPCSHEERYVNQLIIHPSFNSRNLVNDVALLRLDQPLNIQSTPHINSACLPFSGQSFDYQRCWVAGFGKDAFGQSGQFSYIQKEVDVPIVPYNDCQNQLRQTRLGSDFYLDGRSFVCAGGEEGKDSCEGDGGAPLTCDTGNGQWTVAGLVAWGVGCAEANRPGVYVNVASFADWIRSQTGAHNG